MEELLTFKITLVDGSMEEQQLPCDPDQKLEEAKISQAMLQYAKLGLLRKIGRTFTLIPCGRIAKVEVDLPLISLATTKDAAAAKQAAENIKKITLG